MFTMNTQGGTKIEKLISYEALREAASRIPVESGWLPAEVVRWGHGGRLGEWVVAWIAPARYVLELTEGVPGPDEKVIRVTAPLPGLVLLGGGTDYWIWAQKAERLEVHHELFRCPLPNVMQDAKICWGEVKPPIASPRSIMKAFDVFIKSTFNNHAAPGKSKRYPDDVRELLRELARDNCGYYCAEDVGHVDHRGPAEVYPVDDLVRAVDKTGVTLDQLMRVFLSGMGMPE
jgi:hypothetical protein